MCPSIRFVSRSAISVASMRDIVLSVSVNQVCIKVCDFYARAIVIMSLMCPSIRFVSRSAMHYNLCLKKDFLVSVNQVCIKVCDDATTKSDFAAK